MTVRHHPSDETLFRYASGFLSTGPRIVVATHLETCPACRSLVADLEALGGKMLAELPPSHMAYEALGDRLLTSEGRGVGGQRDLPAAVKAPPEGFLAPRPLRVCEIGGWRWVAPGVRLSRVRVLEDPHAIIILLRVKAGRHMPEHGHTGFEVTQVLSGSFSDGGNEYLPGDFVEGDSEAEHMPIIGARSECISLAAIEGQIRFRGFFGRLLQPFVGI